MSLYIVGRCRWVAAILLLLVLGPSIPGPPTAKMHPRMRHAVMRRIETPQDSSLVTGGNTLGTTFNWSGYALTSFNTGISYKAAQGSWVVPSATFVPAENVSNGMAASSNWVGIGGTCTDATCAASDQTLIQIGTESDAFNGGTPNDGLPQYYAWYETVPDAPTIIMNPASPNVPAPVSPGDVITASLQCVANCVAGTFQTWLFGMVNQTKGWTFSEIDIYFSSFTSAEWIEEAPTGQNGFVSALADFGSSSFTATSANGVNPNFDFSADAIQMMDTNIPSPKEPADQTANPSSPFGGDSFSVCWNGGTALAPCAYSGLAVSNPPQPVAAVLPSSRAVVRDATATVFATILNPASVPANSCSIAPATVANTFVGTTFFQTTDPTTNKVNGAVNTPVTIPAHGSQSFVLGLTPTEDTGGTDAFPTDTTILFTYTCQGQLPVVPIVGINSLVFSAFFTSQADVIAEVSTVTNDGTLHIPGTTATGAFAMATANLGAAGPLTVSANTGSAELPLTITLCQTDTTTSECLSPPAASVPVMIAAGAEPTFSIFATAAGAIPFDPATRRIFVQFADGMGAIHGSSSVAVTTN